MTYCLGGSRSILLSYGGTNAVPIIGKSGPGVNSPVESNE